jgi:hypothetical protein
VKLALVEVLLIVVQWSIVLDFRFKRGSQDHQGWKERQDFHLDL